MKPEDVAEGGVYLWRGRMVRVRRVASYSIGPTVWLSPDPPPADADSEIIGPVNLGQFAREAEPATSTALP